MISRFLAVATQVMMMAIVVSVLLLFVGISILVILHICVVGRAVGRGLRGVVAGGGGVVVHGEKDMGLSSKDLETLPCYDFEGSQKGNYNEGSVDCAVCLENFEVGDRCRLLPICGHSFHTICIDSWLRKSSICPICRTNALFRNTEEQWKETERFVEFGGGQSVLSGLPPPPPPPSPPPPPPPHPPPPSGVSAS